MKWFIAAIALLILAFAFELGLLVFAIYSLAVILFVAQYITSTWANNVVLTRTISQTEANAGDVVDVVIDIRNDGRWPITWMLVDDLLPTPPDGRMKPAMEIEGRPLAVLNFGVAEQHQLRYRIRCQRRGYFQIGPTVIETGDMFGFNRRYRVMSEPFYLMVHPDTVSLGGYDIASRRPIGEVIMSNRLFEDPTRIAGIRDYQTGDPLNRIHWRKTASTGQLQCKIYEPSSLAGATIVVDFHREAFDIKQEPVRSELAITAAASLASALMEMGQQVGLVANGRDAADRIRTEGWRGDDRTRNEARESTIMELVNDRLRPVIVPTRKSAEQVMAIHRALARLEKTDGMTMSVLLAETASELPRDATVVAIVSEMSLETAVALGNLKKQGYSVVVLVNSWSHERFLQTTGPLIGEGIIAMHLKDRDSIRSICERQAMMI